MPKEVRRGLSPTSSQRLWAAAGTLIALVTLAIAFSNLRDIYRAQEDFVLGSLLSLAGLCFGRALSRTQEQKALFMWLHDEGVFQQLSRLERNVDAAVDRLSEYYDGQCQELEFYRYSPLLRVALDDLDKAAANVAMLRQQLSQSAEQPDRISSAVRLALISARRDLREATNRRDQTYEWLAGRLDRQSGAEAWDLFAVMTADIIKGTRSVEVLLSQHVPFPPEDYLPTIRGNLTAALKRAREFADVVERDNVPLPKIFDVVMDDVAKALHTIEQIDLGVPVRAGVQQPGGSEAA